MTNIFVLENLTQLKNSLSNCQNQKCDNCRDCSYLPHLNIIDDDNNRIGRKRLPLRKLL